MSVTVQNSTQYEFTDNSKKPVFTLKGNVGKDAQYLSD